MCVLQRALTIDGEQPAAAATTRRHGVSVDRDGTEVGDAITADGRSAAADARAAAVGVADLHRHVSARVSSTVAPPIRRWATASGGGPPEAVSTHGHESSSTARLRPGSFSAATAMHSPNGIPLRKLCQVDEVRSSARAKIASTLFGTELAELWRRPVPR